MSNEFINPYTFIPVYQGKKQAYGSYFEGKLLSGKISCTLRTKTQITVCDETNDPKEKEFFSVNGEPVIPGSEIRGVIRSIYEALTDSCLSSVNAEEDDYFSSRMNKAKPGLLVRENGKYVLYDARRYVDDTKECIIADDKNGDEVIFEPCKTEDGEILFYIYCIGDEEYCFNKGYIHKVDSYNNGENYNSVFEKIEGKPQPIPEEAIKRLEINLERYSPITLDEIKDDYNKAFNKMKTNEGVYLPVWYIYENEHYYFAPSKLSRSIYYNKPIDLLRKQNLQKCESESEICEACSVFGIMSNDGDGFAVPSRLRFSDAVYDKASCNGEPFDKTYRLPILANPNTSAFEFYLTNYDEKNMRISADDEVIGIAGRKYYWHNNKTRITSNSKAEENNMDISAQLLKEGAEFKFEVFFDKITKAILHKLVFALNLGENNINSNQCHKLGHGKPIGLGSVKIIADSITVRSFSDNMYSETDMTSIFSDYTNSSFFDKKNLQSVLRVTNFKAVDGSLISYPSTTDNKDQRATESTGIFKWFAENREKYEPGKPHFHQKLPYLLNPRQTLSKKPKNNRK